MSGAPPGAQILSKNDPGQRPCMSLPGTREEANT